MRLMAVSALAALLAAGAVSAHAQTAGDRADARCLLVMQVAGRDPKNREPASQGTFYYLGRLMAHGLSGKMEPLLYTEGRAINNTTLLKSELTRCGGELTARNNELRGVFVSLAQITRPGAGAPAPTAPPSK